MTRPFAANVAAAGLLALLAVPQTAAGAVLGDANGDGKVDVTDSLWIAQSVATLKPPVDPRVGDVNCDGAVTIVDAMIVAQLSAGRISRLPCAPPPDAYAQARALGRGVNFGNLMDGFPDEGSWSDGLVMEESHFDLAVQAGFDSVRIPIRFSAHALTSAPYTIDGSFMNRVDQVVRWGLARKLRIVIDLHHYEEIQGDPAGHSERFLALWRQIAQHFVGFSSDVYYELMNEPNGNLDGDVWNALVADAIREIRQVDGYHTIIVGAPQWNSVWGLPSLVVPETERNAIVTFHFYEPNVFVMQGKWYMGPNYATTGIVWPGPPSTPVQIPSTVTEPWILAWLEGYNAAATSGGEIPAGPSDLRRYIAGAAQWGIAHGRPLWMGEFCVHNGADMASRARWTRFVREELEAWKIPWSYWTLVSDRNTFLYDLNTQTWVTELTDALGLTTSAVHRRPASSARRVAYWAPDSSQYGKGNEDVAGYDEVQFQASGDTARDAWYYGAAAMGPDGTWFTDDDSPDGWWSQPGSTYGFLLTGPGADGAWFTSDDAIASWEAYGASAGDTAVNVLHDGPGPNGIWFDDDDRVSGYHLRTIDATGAEVRRVTYVGPGPDALWFTADDDISPGGWVANEYADGNTRWASWRRQIAYTDPGPDGVWLTGDDLIGWYRTHAFTEDSEYWTTEITFGAGQDGVWFTADDQVLGLAEAINSY